MLSFYQSVRSPSKYNSFFYQVYSSKVQKFKWGRQFNMPYSGMSLTLAYGQRNLKDKTPIPKCRHCCLGWCCNFVGSESGQKQSVKLLQNMVYNTIQHPPPPPPPSHTSYILYVFRGATVHKYTSFVHWGNSSQAGSKIPTIVNVSPVYKIC